jgi:chromosome segregation ATPase
MSSLAKPEADHLKWIVEKQPSCLMRVGGDSVVLAANDAALALFGADKISQVLGTSFAGFVAASHRETWLGFVGKVTGGASQSLECVVNDVSGTERSVILHGVPLLDHADGILSVLLSIRDNNAIRRMEAALHETEQMRQQAVMSKPEDAHRIEQLQATVTELQSQREQLERTLGELPRLQQLLKQGRSYLQDMQVRLTAATQERDALAQQLTERSASHQQTSAGRDDLERSLAEATAQRDALTAQRDALAAQRDALAAQLTERDSANQQLLVEQESQHKSLVEAHARDLDALRQQLDAVRQQLDAQTTERADLDKRLSGADERCAQLQREREEAEAHVTSHVQRIDALEGRLERAVQDHEQLSADIANRVQQHDAATAAAEERHRTEIAGLRQDLDAAQAQLAHERSTIDALNASLADERANVAATNDTLARAQASLDTVNARLAEEQTKVDAAARTLADTQVRVDSAEGLLAETRANLDAAHRTLGDERTTIETLRRDLADAGVERDRVQTELKDLEAARSRHALEHEAERGRLAQEIAAAISQLNEADKTLSDNRLELQSMDTAIRQIEPLAAAGRVAVEAARDILAAIGDIDARTACLAAESATDASSREQIEQLRADAVRAASLARQILHASRIAQAEERHADSA